eukprot:TRINITY_DN20174_c0_g1_i1.p1 TRINITY_DN20174_c0_g1~~TRINITY_DN20174_c0_g1_i1.p1  ORF type:complete len:576 (+),score=204.71 TRINITY_DN20174_c0_g1_i1:284-2011(+)
MGKKLVRLRRSDLHRLRRRAPLQPPVPAPLPSAPFEPLPVAAEVTGVDRRRAAAEAAVKLGRTALMRATGQEGRTSLRLLLWKLQHDRLGVAGRRVRGTEREVEDLAEVLEANDVDFDTLKRLSSRQVILLFARLRLLPTQRLWLTALLRARPCGAVLFSQDGKHVCLREAVPGTVRCADPQHHPVDAGPKMVAQSPSPVPGAPRALFRQYHGRAVYPVYEVNEEDAMNARVQRRYPEHTVDTVGPALQLVEHLHDIETKHAALGSDPATVGQQEDMERAFEMWAQGQAENPQELLDADAARERRPYRAATRRYEVTLLRGEFDRGGVGEYRRRVAQREKEWMEWLGRMTRVVHEHIEGAEPTGTLQALDPPNLDQMQAAVDRGAAGEAPPSDGLTRPSPLELRSPDDAFDAARRVLRPLDASRSVTAADLLPVMPTVVVRGTVALAGKGVKHRSKHVTSRGPRAPRAGAGSLALTLRVLITKDACFAPLPERQRRRLQRALAALPLPPAVLPFNALFRVDPFERVAGMRQAARERALALADADRDGAVSYLEGGAGAATPPAGGAGAPARLLDI